MLSRPSLAARRAFTAIPSPLGWVVVGASWKGVARVLLAGDEVTARSVGQAHGEWHEACAHPHLLAACQWLDGYFADGETSGLLPEVAFDLSGTPFQRRVWEVIASIPCGATMTYSQLAARAGKPSAVRAAASACGDNPVPLLIPCHRVIAKDGGLGGFSMAGGIATKAWLLEREAVRTPVAA